MAADCHTNALYTAHTEQASYQGSTTLAAKGCRAAARKSETNAASHPAHTRAARVHKRASVSEKKSEAHTHQARPPRAEPSSHALTTEVAERDAQRPDGHSAANCKAHSALGLPIGRAALTMHVWHLRGA